MIATRTLRLAPMLALLAAAAPARADDPPAAGPSAADRRLDELLARQRRLEEQVRAQEALLATLRRTVELPAAGGPSIDPSRRRWLVVRPEELGSIDPEAAAPIAGYSARNFFLRDRHSWFVLVPKGRINVDWTNFLNRPPAPPGVTPNSAADPRSALRDTVFIRRARIGLAGTIARHIDFRVEAEFASLPTPGQYATLADASVVVNYLPYLKLEAGQFYTPFTLENQTSENYTDFMEKSLTVRFVVPNARDTGAMLFGELPRRLGRWYFGVFNGDGQNFKNLDNRPALIGRAFVAPLSLVPRHAAWMEEVWLGGSIWWQQNDNLGGAGPPSTSGAAAGDLANLTTTGGFTVFSSNYANGSDLLKNAVRAHLAPDGTTLKWAVDLNVPLPKRLGLRAEYAHQSIDLREYNDVNPGNGNLTRTAAGAGNTSGWAAYVEAYAWIGGDVNADKPGLYQIPHWNGYIPPPRPEWAVQLAARYEHVALAVGLPPNPGLDPATGEYALDAFELGANLWVTRHARFMTNYVVSYVGAGDPKRAAVNEQKNLFFQRYEHELLFRLQVSL